MLQDALLVEYRCMIFLYMYDARRCMIRVRFGSRFLDKFNVFSLASCVCSSDIVLSTVLVLFSYLLSKEMERER